jgi:hypothetical protein
MTFLSRAERSYLAVVDRQQKKKISDDYGYTIKSRLCKKVQHFVSQELPLLVERGYLERKDLTEFCKSEPPNLTENCKVSETTTAGAAASCKRKAEDLDGGRRIELGRSRIFSRLCKA